MDEQLHSHAVTFSEGRLMDKNENHLIERFPRGLRNHFLHRCERIDLVAEVELVAHGDVLTHAYFPCDGTIALLIDDPGRPAIEVGTVGRECMLGSELLLGDLPSPWRAVVQAPGSCWRMEADLLRNVLKLMPPLLESLQSNFIVQVHQRQAMAWPKSGLLPRETQKASIRSAWPQGFQQRRGGHTASRDVS